MKKDYIITIVAILVLAFTVIGGAKYLFRTSGDSQNIVSNNTKNSNSLYKGAVIDTNMGSIEIEFLSDNAPKTVANIITLIEDRFYDGTKFHRVMKDFMIQGGDPLTKEDDKKAFWGTGGADKRFADEINAKSLGLSDEEVSELENRFGYTYTDSVQSVRLVKGIMAMANSGPDTNSSQFFIITTPETPWLNGRHTGFARVIRGMEVAEAISKVPTEGANVPIKPVVIDKITLK